MYLDNCKVSQEGDKIKIVGPCMFTRKMYTVIVDSEGFKKWMDGAFIQDAMPEVSDDDREFLISGYSPEGWEALFG